MLQIATYQTMFYFQHLIISNSMLISYADNIFPIENNFKNILYID